MKTKSKRLANIELLRIIAMGMVIMLHYLGKGDLLPTMHLHMGANGYAAWILESLAIVAVNVYVLISGYFLVEAEFKPGKIARIVLQVLFYTILLTAVSLAFGIIQVSDLGVYNLIVQLFPFQLEQYWFMTAYLVLYILSPVLALGVKQISKKNLQVVIIAFVVFMSVEKSILPVQIVFDKRGYDALWFICLFLVAAYIRLYGVKFLEKKWVCLLMYFGGCAMAFAENMALFVVYTKTGELAHLFKSPFHYNHIWVLMASLGLFAFFLKVNIKEGIFAKAVCAISPYTLGVYLLHEHMYIKYLWPKWLLAGSAENPVQFVLLAFMAVGVVFLAGICVDYLRSLLFKLGSKCIYGKKTGNSV